jgi:hypothetical protein
MNADEYLAWRKEFMKSLRSSYENEIFGLNSTISEVRDVKHERNECINDDDIINLRIALESSSFEEFLKQV